MTLRDLMGYVINENPPRFLIFFGEEQKVADIYIDKISELGFEKKSLESVAQVISKCSTKSLVHKPTLYLVNEDSEFSKSEGSWDKVKSIVETSGNILIIRYTKLAKNTKFYKRNSDSAVEFNRLDESILSKYITNDLSDFSVDNCNTLCRMCSNDYGRILLEIDKVKHYMKAKSSQDSNKAFEILLYNNAIYSDIGDITFQLTEAVIAGDLDNSFILLEKAKLSGEPVLRICSILYNNFRNMLALECLGSNKSNASARTGLDSKLTYVMLKKLGAYSIRECIRNVNICQRVESGIKTGLIEQDVAMDYLIVSLLS